MDVKELIEQEIRERKVMNIDLHVIRNSYRI